MVSPEIVQDRKEIWQDVSSTDSCETAKDMILNHGQQMKWERCGAGQCGQ